MTYVQFPENAELTVATPLPEKGPIIDGKLNENSGYFLMLINAFENYFAISFTILTFLGYISIASFGHMSDFGEYGRYLLFLGILLGVRWMMKKL